MGSFGWAAVSFGLGALPLVFRYYDSLASDRPPTRLTSYPEIWVYVIAIAISVISAAVVERSRYNALASIAATGSAFALAVASFAYARATASLLSPAEANFAELVLLGIVLLAVFFIVPEKIGDCLRRAPLR